MGEQTVVRSVSIERSERVMQVEGMFDLLPAERYERSWYVRLPLEERDWRIGLIVGPSGSGKTTILRDCFTDATHAPFAWPERRAVLDGFPESMSIKQIVSLLSSVGFASPPAWLRPFACLSNGEQFRVSLARSLAEAECDALGPGLVVVDEYSSTVDRTAARIASAALARHLRRPRADGERGQPLRLVAATCHADVIDWLQPDWIHDTANGEFAWRSLQPRPSIELEVARVSHQAWRLFRPHHYLTASLHPSAWCFVGVVEGSPAAFVAVLPQPGRIPYWREHRLVTLPDFQGIGLGNAMAEFIASLFAATGRPYRGVTSHPALIAHRHRSHWWEMEREPSMVTDGRHHSYRQLNKASSAGRLTSTFRYIGPADRNRAAAFALPVARDTRQS